MNRKDMIDTVIQLEYRAFDRTKNLGGRAACQDDRETFYIMRASQYQAWNEETLASYLGDLCEAQKQGRNLVTEKYGRMMEHTAPEEYARIKDCFPPLGAWQKQAIDGIAAIQVRWMEEFAAAHPNISSRARKIHAFEDTEEETSYETYLRGELATYSEETLAKYAAFIVELARDGKNLAEMIMSNTIRFYGYSSFEEVRGLEI